MNRPDIPAREKVQLNALQYHVPSTASPRGGNDAYKYVPDCLTIKNNWREPLLPATVRLLTAQHVCYKLLDIIFMSTSASRSLILWRTRNSDTKVPYLCLGPGYDVGSFRRFA